MARGRAGAAALKALSVWLWLRRTERGAGGSSPQTLDVAIAFRWRLRSEKHRELSGHCSPTVASAPGARCATGTRDRRGGDRGSWRGGSLAVPGLRGRSHASLDARVWKRLDAGLPHLPALLSRAARQGEVALDRQHPAALAMAPAADCKASRASGTAAPAYGELFERQAEFFDAEADGATSAAHGATGAIDQFGSEFRVLVHNRPGQSCTARSAPWTQRWLWWPRSSAAQRYSRVASSSSTHATAG